LKLNELPTLEEALRLRLPIYLGSVCKRNHDGRRKTMDQHCVECDELRSETQKKNRIENNFILRTNRWKAKHKQELTYISDRACFFHKFSERETSTGQCLECKKELQQGRLRNRSIVRTDLDKLFDQVLQKRREDAKKKGLYFDLTKSSLAQIYPNDGKCPICHQLFKRGERRPRDSSPSLDRILHEPNIGYRIENVVFICYRCNTLHSNATSCELKRLFDFYKEKEKTVKQKLEENNNDKSSNIQSR
jgi:hypothetical protein